MRYLVNAILKILVLTGMVMASLNIGVHPLLKTLVFVVAFVLALWIVSCYLVDGESRERCKRDLSQIELSRAKVKELSIE